MAKHNLAYDLSKYENANLGEKPEKSKINLVKHRPGTEGSAFRVVVSAGVALIFMLMVVYAKVQDASLHKEIISLNKQADILHSENVRMKSDIEGKSSIKAVEEYAENILGMRKLEKSQIEYISIENGNIVNIPEAETNIFIKIKNLFSNLVEYIRG